MRVIFFFVHLFKLRTKQRTSSRQRKRFFVRKQNNVIELRKTRHEIFIGHLTKELKNHRIREDAQEKKSDLVIQACNFLGYFQHFKSLNLSNQFHSDGADFRSDV